MKYEVLSWRERLELRVNPVICRVFGCKPRQKMSCVICDRCRVVLR